MCLSPVLLLSCVDDYVFLCVVSVCSCFTVFVSNVIVITYGYLFVFYVLCHFSVVYSLQLCHCFLVFMFTLLFCQCSCLMSLHSVSWLSNFGHVVLIFYVIVTTIFELP